jgi:hypothetical protein
MANIGHVLGARRHEWHWDRGAHKVRKERAKDGSNWPKNLVNYEIERLDKMTVF